MDTNEIEKATAHITVEIIEYVPNSVVIKTILKKSTGSVSVMSVDSGEGLAEKTTAFDTYAQVIEGKADIVIAGVERIAHGSVDRDTCSCSKFYKTKRAIQNDFDGD